ncbi:MAG: FAD-dependent oxidoreductase, partial [Rhodospirillales bacterium]
MLKTYAYPKYQFRLPTGAGGDTVARYPVVVVGAGPVGMAAAIDLAQQGVPVVILDDDDTVSVGSRGVCYAKRALEVLDRLGVGDPVVDKGVSWNVGRTFFREEEVYNFNLKPNADQKRPGMINLQQYYLEEYEINRLAQFDTVELCWKNKVVGVEPQDDKVTVKVQTPDGFYTLETDWLIVADGARSPIRSM